ncbi:hypothetical protein B0H14DRAFT_2612278 [Mycena olivaceomarginata]|nr:hypothetical protein B0H14DRAFT_2612278 [Mycena olivaceomarginata]
MALPRGDFARKGGFRTVEGRFEDFRTSHIVLACRTSPPKNLVSPWMKSGTVLKYLNDHGREDLNRLVPHTYLLGALGSMLGVAAEIRSWIKDGQRRLTLVVGNFYNELVCGKLFLESDDKSTFATCPAAGAFENDVWRFIWQYLPTCSRRKLDRLPRTVAEVERECLDKINITFLMEMPEYTRNTIIVGALGLELSHAELLHHVALGEVKILLPHEAESYFSSSRK